MTAKRLAGLLGDPVRARVWAGLLLAVDPGVGEAEAAKARKQLAAAGLVSESGAASLQPLVDAAAGRDSDPGAGHDDATASVLRAFLDSDGRLKEIPASWQKRQVVLEHISQFFEIGERYPEVRVNEILQGFHRDHAALRRYLVDSEFLSRGEGFYWRSGGRTT